MSAVEQVEVVHLKNQLEAFAKVEVLSHVGIFVVRGGAFGRAIVAYGVAEDIPRRRFREGRRVEYLS